MKKRAVILSALMLTLFASSMGALSMGRVKAAGVADNADWNKKTVTITMTNDYTKYTQTSQYTLDSVGVWQWGKKDSSTGRYSVYFDAADIKKMAYLYQNSLQIPDKYARNCVLHDKTVEALK